MDPGPLIVDFYLYSSHEVAVWEPIWRSLRRRGVDARIVLEPPGIHRAIGSVPDAAAGWHDDKNGTRLEPLVDPTTHAHLEDLLRSRDLPWIDHSRSHAHAVITTQGTGWLHHYHGLRIKTEYGASSFVDVYGHGPINNGLDLVLAHGPFSARAISAHVPMDRIKVVGYPKWSPALRSGLERAAARDLLDLPHDRTLVAWLPTWAHNATIDDYRQALAELAESHTVVAKPHHNNVRFESARLAEIDQRIVVRSDLHSLVELMIAADVVVADGRSGALAETILADRPAVGLLPGVSPRANGIVEGLGDAVVWCRKPGDLAAAVADALGTDRGNARDGWRRWLYADFAGYDDDVAADAIIGAVRNRLRPTTAVLPLAELDELLDQVVDGPTLCRAFAAAWPVWPGHPRLCQLLQRHRHELDDHGRTTCARLVREDGRSDLCPLFDVVDDGGVDPVTRTVAAAALAVVFDEEMSERFVTLVGQVDPADFSDALTRLDATPAAIPVFLQAAATTPDRCDALARALTRLGADTEAQLLLDHGRTLVTR